MNITKNSFAMLILMMSAAIIFLFFRTDSRKPIDVDCSDYMETNSDFFGILEIRDLLLEPVVQGQDNSYYLSHGFSKSEDRNGCLFVDEAYSENCMNLVIYGHNSFNGTGFSNLIKFKDPDFIQSHPEISLTSSDGTCSVFRIAMILNYSTGDIVTCDPYQTQLPPDHLSRCRRYARYYIDENVRLDSSSRILTLSTCDETVYGSEGRLIIVAIREDC